MDNHNDPKRAAFLSELRNLLAKHHVSISAGVGQGSDTHGLHDEHITVEHRPIPGSFKEVEWLRVDGWSIGADDLDHEEN